MKKQNEHLLQTRLLAMISKRMRLLVYHLWGMTAAIIIAMLVVASTFAIFPEGYPPPGPTVEVGGDR